MGGQVGVSTPYIRGVGNQNGAAGDEASVPTYVDGVYVLALLSGFQSFNDIERVEVLKGPQGTLFGRNSTGGLINIITKDPSQETSIKTSVTYGNYDTVEANFYGTTGLTPAIATAVSAYYTDQGQGWGRNLTTGAATDKSKELSFRNKWAVTLSDTSRLKISFNYAQTWTSDAIERAVSPGATGLGDTTYSGHWFDVESDINSYIRNEAWGTSLRFDQDFKVLDFASISAYSGTRSLQFLDQDVTPIDFLTAPLYVDTDMETQEFQLISKDKGPLEWIAGTFLMRSTSKYNPFELLGSGVSAYFGPGATVYQQFPTQVTTSTAIYGQAKYWITNTTNVTAGIRETHDERAFSYTGQAQYGANTPFIQLFDSTSSKSWTEPTWRFSLDHNFTDDVLAYISYSRGFKSGVYNFAAIPAAPPVNPETVDAYELGLKSSLFDKRLTMNASVFYYRDKNIQLSQILAGSSELLNAARGTIKGFDMDMRWIATKGLSLTGGLSYVAAVYQQFPDAPLTTADCCVAPTSFNAAGQDMIRTPRFTGNIGANYSVPTSAGLIDATVDYYYNSGFYWEPDNRTKQPSYSIIDARLAWSPQNGHTKFWIYGKNLENKHYMWFSNSGSLGDDYAPAPPLTTGVGFEYSY